MCTPNLSHTVALESELPSESVPEFGRAKPTVVVYENEDVRALAQSADGKDQETRSRIMTVVRQLKASGGRKPLAVVPPNWSVFVDQLAYSYPNFSDFVELLRDQFTLSSVLGDGRVVLPPVLLDGPPGIGKTDIALTLGEWLGTRALVLDMASAQSGAALSGSDTFWSNSQPGQLFDVLAGGATANPIVVLDELDKVSEDGRHRPDSALYQLLEPRSAARFRDLSAPQVTLDASHVLWIATTNDTTRVPQPIRSRFVELSVPSPTREQVVRIAHRIYASFRKARPWAQAMSTTLPDSVAQLLCDSTPRAIRVQLERACGRAARQGRRELAVEDVELSEHASRRGIGFISLR
ncbi:MAG: AAA family ATPase [Aromatoleum sp.]|jgi:ATP-dependent Lon protease|uniref:AAA family ATPase n=1 Tax=Aromatoleum sp. TaxID=2307007 RepID=UPI0028954807|nr:AAA family ATPase [Aromatoleum sp.]MDT3670866.1 AAA family ATPase [Aromatoleum sp.]